MFQEREEAELRLSMIDYWYENLFFYECFADLARVARNLKLCCGTVAVAQYAPA